MPIGSTVRGLLGPRLDRVVADRYRRMFVDLDALAATIVALDLFHSVVEVGCGDGALLSRLMAELPADARGLGIDIAANPGRSYTGPDRVEFRQTDVATVVAAGQRFDLVVVSDVLHHVPVDQRSAFLVSCQQLLEPGGTLVVKEWVRRRNLAHLAAYTSDRFISGDRGVSFYNEHELRDALRGAMGDHSSVLTSYVRPHWNNVILAGRATAGSDSGFASMQ